MPAIARRMRSDTGENARILPAGADSIAEAIALLRAGGIAAIPTETVYGLAADAGNEAAVASIYAAKGRPSFNPLIVHVADLPMAKRYGHFSPLALQATAAFWPGALTLVVPLAPGAPLAPSVTAGLPTVALRMPAHPVMQAVIAGLGRGVAAPSANASGRLSPTTAAHVAESLAARIPLILDAGPCAAGLESTIVAVSGETATLLRAGAIPREALEAALGRTLATAANGEISAPGMMLAHYAPSLPLRLNAVSAAAHEYHLGFGAIAGDESLSPRGSLTEAASKLFAALHRAQASGRAGIAVAPIPADGLGIAINDRLGRAVSG